MNSKKEREIRECVGEREGKRVKEMSKLRAGVCFGADACEYCAKRDKPRQEDIKEFYTSKGGSVLISLYTAQ